jgi:hypothetical protein
MAPGVASDGLKPQRDPPFLKNPGPLSMEKHALPQINDPSTAARYLGEIVGTHYSAALRATEAYGRHLASKRDSLLAETFEGEGLGEFWRELLKSEKVRLGSGKVLKGLSTTPSHYFFDFLDTAEEVYRKRYLGDLFSKRNKAGKMEHAQCLAFLRDHCAGGVPDHFTVQNKIATWKQLLRVVGRYQE